MLELSIEIKGVRLIVDGEYYEAEPWTPEEPAEAESFEVHKVMSASGDNLTGLFDDNAFEIDKVCLKALRDLATDAKAAREADERLRVL